MKHVLHTFRPEERLGELRLGLAEPPPPPPQQVEGEGRGSETKEPPTRSSGDDDAHGGGGDGSRNSDCDASTRGDTISSTTTAGGSGGADRRYEEAQEERERPRENGSKRAAEEEERIKQHRVGVGVEHGSGRRTGPDERRQDHSDTPAQAGGGDGAVKARQPQSSMWRSRWIYRDRRSPAMEPDELQVEVRVCLADACNYCIYLSYVQVGSECRNLSCGFSCHFGTFARAVSWFRLEKGVNLYSTIRRTTPPLSPLHINRAV